MGKKKNKKGDQMIEMEERLLADSNIVSGAKELEAQGRTVLKLLLSESAKDGSMSTEQLNKILTGKWTDFMKRTINDIDESDKGRCALSVAIKMIHKTEWIRALVDNGADPDLELDVTDNKGVYKTTPLNLLWQLDQAQFSIKISEPIKEAWKIMRAKTKYTKDSDGRSVLMNACQCQALDASGAASVVESCVKNNENVLTEVDNYTEANALFHACYGGNYHMYSMLRNKYPDEEHWYSPNDSKRKKDKYGRGMFFYACLGQNIQIVVDILNMYGVEGIYRKDITDGFLLVATLDGVGDAGKDFIKKLGVHPLEKVWLTPKYTEETDPNKMEIASVALARSRMNTQVRSILDALVIRRELLDTSSMISTYAINPASRKYLTQFERLETTYSLLRMIGSTYPQVAMHPVTVGIRTEMLSKFNVSFRNLLDVVLLGCMLGFSTMAGVYYAKGTRNPLLPVLSIGFAIMIASMESTEIFMRRFAYFKSLSNTYDWITLSVVVIGDLMMLSSNESDTYWQKIVAVGLFMNWLKFLQFLLLLPGKLGKNIHIIVNMLSTTRVFTFILGLFMITFAFSFYFVLTNQDGYTNVVETIITMFRGMLGDMDFDVISNSFVAEIFFILFGLLIMVLLINFLVAIMSSAYEDNTEEDLELSRALALAGEIHRAMELRGRKVADQLISEIFGNDWSQEKSVKESYAFDQAVQSERLVKIQNSTKQLKNTLKLAEEDVFPKASKTLKNILDDRQQISKNLGRLNKTMSKIKKMNLEKLKSKYEKLQKEVENKVKNDPAYKKFGDMDDDDA